MPASSLECLALLLLLHCRACLRSIWRSIACGRIIVHIYDALTSTRDTVAVLCLASGDFLVRLPLQSKRRRPFEWDFILYVDVNPCCISHSWSDGCRTERIWCTNQTKHTDVQNMDRNRFNMWHLRQNASLYYGGYSFGWMRYGNSWRCSLLDIHNTYERKKLTGQIKRQTFVENHSHHIKQKFPQTMQPSPEVRRSLAETVSC